MSTDQPGSGSPDDPFAKRPQDSGGSPYDQPPPGGPYGGGPYDTGGPYGAPPVDPLAGMPPLADAGKRIVARIIDVIIVLIPAGLIDWAAGGVHTDSFSGSSSAIGGALTAVIGFFYEWFLTKATGQTVGKRAMRIRAAMLDNGSVPGGGPAATRAMVLWLPSFCCSCFWFLIIGATVLFDKPYKQGLHDKAAKTVVVQVV